MLKVISIMSQHLVVWYQNNQSNYKDVAADELSLYFHQVEPSNKSSD